MRWIVLTADELAQAQTLDDDENFVISGREVDIGPMAGQHAVPARMIVDPACPPRLAQYLSSQAIEDIDPADLFAPSDAA